MEASLKQITLCTSFAECRAVSDELQVMLATEMPYVVLYNTNTIEIYRSATVEFPYTEQFGGLGYTHIGGQIIPSVLVK
jgi:hypothetical protein